MDLPLSQSSSSGKRVTVIDGSAGLRMTIAALVQSHFPDVTIEDIDPFSQTMRGAGMAISASGSAIVLGGVGTEAEANDALKRLRSRNSCPPVVMLVAESLISLRDTFVAAGAFEVLRKDAVSGNRLKCALERAFASQEPSSNATTTATAPEQTSYGKFMFLEDGERVGIDIDGYRPVETISSGTMAQVYLAESTASGGQAAVKILTSVPMRNIADLSQIIAVAKRLRPLRGGSVVRELDSGISANYLYVVLEFLKKGDLRRRLKAPLDGDEAVHIMHAFLVALGDLHKAGVCHADLKPESIFFRTDGSIALIDFNISTLFGQAVRCSAAGDMLGTPTYLSPEQGAGKAVDARSDLYAAGIIFFEMLTGAPPFIGDTAAQTLFRHLHDEVPLLPKKVRHLQAIVDRMLAKSIDERFQHASEIIAALNAAVAHNSADPN